MRNGGPELLGPRAAHWTTDEELVLTSLDGAALADLGVSREQALGRPIAGVALDADNPLFDELLHRRALDGESVAYARLIGDREYRIFVERRTDPDGETVGCIGTLLDVSAPVTDARARLAENEEIIHALYELASADDLPVDERVSRLLRLACMRFGLEMGVLMKRVGDRLIVENLVAPADCGFTVGTSMPYELTFCSSVIDSSKVVGIDNVSASSWRDHPGTSNGWESYLGAPVHVADEIYGSLCFGAREPAHTPFADSDRNLLQLMARWIGTEFERVQSSRDLEASHARFEKLAENMPGAIYQFWLDPHTEERGFQYMSPGSREMWGLDPDEAIQRPEEIIGMIHPDDETAFEKSVELSATTLQPWKWEGRIVQNGKVKWLQGASRPEQLSDGRVLWDGLILDVTAHKEIQEQARQLEADLAHVTRLTTLGEMASGLAHELNQPLSAIANYAEGVHAMLEAGNVDRESLLDVSARLAKLALRAGMIVQRMRRMVRKQDPVSGPVDLNELIRETLTFIESDGRMKQAEIALELCDELPLVLGDTVQLQQVVLNLVRNGLDAMDGVDSSERRLSVRTSLVDERAQLAVADSGCGLPAEQESDVFEPFVSTKNGGMGMGLAISRSLVESHGGRLWAEPARPRGAVFYVSLPIDGLDGGA